MFSFKEIRNRSRCCWQQARVFPEELQTKEHKIMNDLEKLFLAELKDLYDAEKQIEDALPEMEEYAHSTQLKEAFHRHLEQTHQHVNRLERVFREIGQEPKRKSCKGVEGIIDEGQSMAKEFRDNSALDAALIESGQKVEHYEITSYGTLCSWAEQLGKGRVAELLMETLNEEKETDQRLTRLAEASRNADATRHSSDVHEGIIDKIMS